MSCRTGPADRGQVERVLAAAGWCPDHPEDSAYIRTKKSEVLAKLPDPVRAEVAARDPVLITTFPNVWGLASFDRRHLLVLCLFSDDLEVVKQQCGHVAVTFAHMFERLLDGVRCEFDPHVEIRRFDGNHLVANGTINDTGRVRFRRYVWSVRRRERVTLLLLAALCVLSTAVALVLYLRLPEDGWAYARGYLDRLSSAVLTAVIVMLANLVFEYRDWKGAGAVIEWSLAP